jgi:starch phosphorylase
VVFTTHTPVPAGNETYPAEEFAAAYGELAGRLGLAERAFLGLFRIDPADEAAPVGMSAASLRLSRRRNGVSRLHGEVARRMWQPMYPGDAEVPITHVTNGADVATFVSEPLRRLFDRYLQEGWSGSAETAVWEGVRQIPNEELWAARCEARRRLVEYARVKSERDRLLRGEQLDTSARSSGRSTRTRSRSASRGAWPPTSG